MSDFSNNYVLNYRFWLEIGGVVFSRFSECHGLGVKIKKDVYFEGGLNDQQRIFLGHAEFSDITLKRGITDNDNFSAWLGAKFAQKHTRTAANLVLYNQAGMVMMSWHLIGSIPTEWKVAPLQADGKSVAIEELVLAIEGLQIAKTFEGSTPLPQGRDSSGFYGASIWEKLN